MNFFCPPVLATIALFTSVVLLDILRHDFDYVSRHGFLGFLSIFLMAVLCEYNAIYVAWALLFLPFILLIISTIIEKSVLAKDKSEPNTMMSPSYTEKSCSNC
jgi:hypothetical protein